MRAQPRCTCRRLAPLARLARPRCPGRLDRQALSVRPSRPRPRPRWRRRRSLPKKQAQSPWPCSWHSALSSQKPGQAMVTHKFVSKSQTQLSSSTSPHWPLLQKLPQVAVSHRLKFSATCTQVHPGRSWQGLASSQTPPHSTVWHRFVSRSQMQPGRLRAVGGPWCTSRCIPPRCLPVRRPRRRHFPGSASCPCASSRRHRR